MNFVSGLSDVGNAVAHHFRVVFSLTEELKAVALALTYRPTMGMRRGNCRSQGRL